jgi:hypothetical protein
MDALSLSVAKYQRIREQVGTEEPDLDERTLADTVEGLTDLHEIVAAIIRSALTDEALAKGLRGRIKEMQQRLERLEDRVSKRRGVARDVMLETGIKRIAAPDFTVSIRDGSPSLIVTDEAAIPTTYWQPQAPKLDRLAVLGALKQGNQVSGAALSNNQPELSVRTS